MKRAVLFSYFLFSTVLVWGQESFLPAVNQPHISALQIEGEIKIDGHLSEPEWNRAPIATQFTQVEPFQGKPSGLKSEVRLLYNKSHLIVGVTCFEPEGRKALRAPDLKRDFSWRAHDTFAICFDGFNDGRNSMSFAINPYEAQKDYLSFDDTFFDSDWNGLWKVRTVRHDSSWTAEIEIPWKTLRYPAGADSVRSWGVNFLRLRRFSNEISVWSPYPRSFGFNRMEYVGKVDGLRAPPPSFNVQFNPYVLTSFHEAQNSSGEITSSSDLKLGGEVKWAVNANTILDLTANTDFAQADADVRVNNISRFSVFFPERRQFFLENASLFGSGLTPNESIGGRMVFLPFFSRTIGLSNGQPLPMDGGLRYVHRSLKENYGVIAMRQRESSESPLTHVGVGRYSRNIGKQNRLGALATYKMQSAAGLQSANTNALVGMDGFFRFGKASSLTGMLLRSDESDQRSGFGGYGQYLYTTNTIQAWWTETVASEHFNPELGFVSRQNVIATTPGVFTNLRGKWLPLPKIVRAFKPGVSAEWYHKASTREWIEKEIKVYPAWFEFQSGAYAGFSWSHVRQNLEFLFQPLGVPIQPGVYQYMRQVVFAGTDQSRKVSAIIQQEWGPYFDGSLASTDANIGFAPLPQISLRAGINRNQFSGIGEDKQNRQVILYTLESRLAWSPRLQLVGLYQHNTQNKLDAYNIRLAWEYKPLSYVYLVFNNRAFDDLQGRLKEQTGIFKVSYLKQF